MTAALYHKVLLANVLPLSSQLAKRERAIYLFGIIYSRISKYHSPNSYKRRDLLGPLFPMSALRMIS